MKYNIKNKIALVTGATGFIGSNVIKRIMLEGGSVIAFVRESSKTDFLKSLGVEIAVGDLTNKSTILNAIKGCQIIFNCAGVLGNEFKPRLCFKNVNVEGTRILAEAAVEEKIERFIHISSAWVYGFAGTTNTDENSQHILSNDPYCDTKVKGEQIIRKLHHEKNLTCIIIQPSPVYGPDGQTWTRYPIELIHKRKMVLPNGGNGIIQPIYISDLVNGIMLATLHGGTGESYILSGLEVVTIKNFFGHYLKMLNRKFIPSVPGWVAMSFASVFELIAEITKKPMPYTRCAVHSTLMNATYNINKAENELGFYPKITLDEGMSFVKKCITHEGGII